MQMQQVLGPFVGAACVTVSYARAAYNWCCDFSLEVTFTTGALGTTDTCDLVLRTSMWSKHHIFWRNTFLDQPSACNEASRSPFSAPTIVFIRPKLKVCFPNRSMAWLVKDVAVGLLANSTSARLRLNASTSSRTQSSCAREPSGTYICSNKKLMKVPASQSASRPLHPQHAPKTTTNSRLHAPQAASRYKGRQFSSGYLSLCTPLPLMQHPGLEVGCVHDSAGGWFSRLLPG